MAKWTKPKIVEIQPMWLDGSPDRPVVVGPYPCTPYNGWLCLTRGWLRDGGHAPGPDGYVYIGPEAAVKLRDYLAEWIESWDA